MATLDKKVVKTETVDSKVEAETIDKFAFKETKVVKLLYKPTPAQDSFSIDAHSWHTCRDQFAPVFLTKRTMYYAWNISKFGAKSDDEAADNIKRFVHDTERKLGWKLTDFHRTNFTNMLFISLNSDKWMNAGNLFRTLFTLLLRTGVNYSKGQTYESTLKKNSYAKSSIKALFKLLNGYTVESKKYKSGRWLDVVGSGNAEAILLPNENLVSKQAYQEWIAAGKPDNAEEELYNKAKENLKKKSYDGVEIKNG